MLRSLVKLEGVQPCTHFLRARGAVKQNPHPSDSPRGGPASVCLSPSPRQEGGLERVLRTNPLWVRKCSSILASLWLANRAFLSAGRTVPVQGALRDTDPLRSSRGSSGISR